VMKTLLLAFCVAFFALTILAKPLNDLNKNERATNYLNGAVKKFLKSNINGAQEWKAFFQDFVSGASEFRSIGDRDPYGYYQFVPLYINSLNNTEGASVSWNAPCFGPTTAVLTKTTREESIISIETTQNNTESCEDFYAIGTVQDIVFVRIEKTGVREVKWDLILVRDAQRWDVNNNGFRIFRFLNDASKTIDYALQTFELFTPMLEGPGIPEELQRLNMDFLKNYPEFVYPRRKTGDVTLNASLIQSGDFFGITRPDGLDPMIIFGMGGTTGHTATALWIDDELYVCESTVNSVYWPTNGVQKTPYETWIKQAQEASYLTVHVPLSPEYAAKYNATSALEFFNTVEGLNYGYHNFLFGWVDTPNSNFPCLPPHYPGSECLTEELLQVISGVIDIGSPSTATLMYNEALNFRINATMNTTAEIYQYAWEQKSLSFGELIVIPEQDDWVYSDGKNMVCDVFVCSMWKAAGLFGDLVDEFQCSELTPFDVYRLNFFDTSGNRPQQCVDADPDLPFCQLMGNYELNLPKYNTVAPYANMAQTCPGQPPNYSRPVNC